MLAVRRLDLRCGATPRNRATPPTRLGAQSVTAVSFTVQWDGTGVAKIDVT